MAHCTSCLSRVCQACETKYFLTNTKECSGCPAQCDTCTDSSTCTKCTAPYLLYHSQCVSGCPAKTFLSNGECLDCPNNCDQCSTTSTCDQCTSPYLLYQSAQCILSSSCTGGRFVSGTQCLGKFLSFLYIILLFKIAWLLVLLVLLSHLARPVTPNITSQASLNVLLAQTTAINAVTP